MNSRRIVGKVEEKSDTLQGTVLLEIAGEESGSLQVDTHGTENDGEVLLVAVVDTLVGDTLLLDETSLSANLGGDFVVRQTRRREDWDLLATSDGVHGVNSRDTGRNHFFGVFLATVSIPSATVVWGGVTYTGEGVDGTAVDVEVVLGEDLGALVDSSSGTIKDTTKHVLRHTELQALARELDFRLSSI